MKKVFILSSLFLSAFTVFCQNADSLSAASQVDSLIQVSRTLTGQRDFDKALEVNAAAEKIALEKLGKETVSYGNVCFNYGRIFYFKRNLTEAEKWYLESKSIREKTWGKEHPDYARLLSNLANVYFGMGKYGEAELLYLEAKDIQEKVLGNEHPDYAGSLGNLANVYLVTGNYRKAEPLYLEAKTLLEKKLGKEHPRYAEIIYNLALIYHKMGNYEKAEPLYLEAKAIREKVLGKEHPDYAESLNNLAVLYMDMGNYDKAEQFHLEARAIREKVLGKEHPKYAASLNNLAVLYRDMGYYEKVEPLYLEAKAIVEKNPGKEHPDYAASLTNLAVLYQDMGHYEKAGAFYLEAKSICEKALGKEHPRHAESLTNLANLYQKTGQYEKAEPLCLEAQAIWEKSLGKEHPEYAKSLNTLANLYKGMGHYEKAEPYYLEAKTIWEKSLGKEHPNYAGSLYNLAVVNNDMGHYEKAEPFYLEAKAIREKVMGKEHPDYSHSLNSLALLYQAMGNYETAGQLFAELAGLNQSLITKSLYHLSGRELENYLNTFSIRQDAILSFTQISPGNSVQLCFDNALFYKGFLLNAANQIRRLAYSDSVSAVRYNILKSYHRRLAAEYAKPIAGRNNVSELEARADSLEKILARSVAGFANARRDVTWQDVQAHLKPGEAAVEFVHFQYYNQKGKATDTTLYAALVLSPGSPAPAWVSLFGQQQPDMLLPAGENRAADYANRLYAPGSALYDLVWKPLEAQLQGVKTIYFSPSGTLHRINFDAIATGPGAMLADRCQLVQLGSTRHLVIPPEVATANNDAALFGGIRYDADSASMSPSLSTLLPDEEPLASRGNPAFNAVFDSTLRGGAWGYLSFTEREVSSIETILAQNKLKPITRRGTAATEEAFKRLGQGGASPRVLHVATHGFFFPDPTKTVDDRRWTADAGNAVFKLSDNPMMRSGLLLAGANRVWKGEPQIENLEDGILTAYEISQMNLSNTELVVLSACETGLGDIKGNEGVYGLQRAFKIAGAKYVIMSLWQVPDKQTSQLMTAFYRNWLEQKMSIPDAFRTAQKQMRDLGLEPYKWAGFVLVE